MKTILSKILIVLLLLSPALTIAASPVHYPIHNTHFSGSEQFTRFGDWGTYKVVSGVYFTKDFIVYDADTTDDPRVSGEAVTTVNMIYTGDPYFGTGPLWGTIHLTNSGGGWNIIFSGYQPSDCHTKVYGLGRGEGGYQGLTAVWEYKSDDCMYTSTISGVITEHHR